MEGVVDVTKKEEEGEMWDEKNKAKRERGKRNEMKEEQRIKSMVWMV